MAPPFQEDLLPPFLSQGSEVSAAAIAQMAQTPLKPRVPRPVPILRGQPIAFVAAEVHSALSKD